MAQLPEESELRTEVEQPLMRQNKDDTESTPLLKDEPLLIQAASPKPRKVFCTPQRRLLAGRFFSSALSVSEATIVGMAVGYGVYSVITILDSARGNWGYSLVAIFGVANGMVEIVSLAGKIPKRNMRRYEVSREAFGNSLASTIIVNEWIHKDTRLLIADSCITAGLTVGQILNNVVLERPEQTRCVRGAKYGAQVLKGLFGFVFGAGAVSYALSIYKGFGGTVIPSLQVFGQVLTGLLNTVAQYGYSVPARIVRNGVSTLTTTSFLLTLLLDISEDIIRSDDEAPVQLAMCLAIAGLLGISVFGKRFVRDVSPDEEAQRPSDEADNRALRL